MDPNNVSGKKIALAVCGGIAAYKVVEVARQLTKLGADVHVVMSPSAMNFVGAITFSTLTGNPVRSELFPETAPSQIPHTDLGRTADLVLVAPATAKTMAEYSHGISESLISALLLSARGPILMAPAMHTEMWDDEATAANIEVLRSRGVVFVGPEKGALAGPDSGIGRMAEPEQIIDAVNKELAATASMEGLSVLVTAGGTREPIDAVRFIGNRSSGKMGFAIAFEALRRGAKVTLITAPTSLGDPEGAEVVRVTTAHQMHEAVMSAAPSADVIIMSAAVADWRPVSSSEVKLKKSAGPPRLELEATVDILEELGRTKRADQILVGFAAETAELEANGRQKLEEKRLDLLVANDVTAEGAGFDHDTNRGLLIDAGSSTKIPPGSKRDMARRLLEEVVRLRG